MKSARGCKGKGLEQKNIQYCLFRDFRAKVFFFFNSKNVILLKVLQIQENRNKENSKKAIKQIKHQTLP